MMNIGQLYESLDVDVETSLEILQLFYDTAQNDLATMKAAFGSNSPKLLMESAHSVKDAAGNMGFKEIED
jgi:HPt (histidine-containing phosphotransfer) domain-containing protein